MKLRWFLEFWKIRWLLVILANIRFSKEFTGKVFLSIPRYHMLFPIFSQFVTVFSLFVQQFWCYHWKELLLGILEFIAVFSQRTANLLNLRDNVFTWPWVKLDLCLLTMLHYWEEIKGNLLPQRLLAFFSNLTMLQYWEEIKGKWFTSLSPYYSISSE